MNERTAELCEPQIRFRSFFEGVDEGCCIIEKIESAAGQPIDFRYVAANAAFASHSGIERVIGRSIRQVAPGEDEEWFQTYDTVLRTGIPIRFERGLVTQGRVLEVFAFRIDVLPAGQVGVMFTDVTAAKALEARHYDSEMRYRRLFESAKDGILILDYATGKIVDANPFIGELLACPIDTLHGKELWEIGLFKDKSASEAAVREMQAVGYIRFEHLPFEATTGRQVDVEIVGNVYQEGSHRVMQCNVRDISERIRLERITQQQSATLTELHNRKDEFLAMLSHELRTPLAPIASAVRMLGFQTDERPIQRQAREIIERQVVQLTHLIDDLLEVSRLTTGKVHLRASTVVLNDIVKHAIESTRPLMEWRRHEMAVQLPVEPLALFADAARLEQVLVNLLTNAAKYTDDGGRISLELSREEDTAVLRLRDNGVGIAADLLPRIFDLFTQAKRSLDRAQGGLGIGLCLVQRLVELHGGSVDVRSILGEGSEFVVRLPIAETIVLAVSEPSLTSSGVMSSTCEVLVVDDSVDTATSMAMLLAAQGHQVRVAYEGRSALQMIHDRRPDVVLMDIGLPGLDGFEIARQIRAQSALGDVVLVAMTGYGQDADRKRTQDAGFNRHLVKPADFTELDEILSNIVPRLR